MSTESFQQSLMAIIGNLNERDRLSIVENSHTPTIHGLKPMTVNNKVKFIDISDTVDGSRRNRGTQARAWRKQS